MENRRVASSLLGVAGALLMVASPFRGWYLLVVLAGALSLRSADERPRPRPS